MNDVDLTASDDLSPEPDPGAQVARSAELAIMLLVLLVFNFAMLQPWQNRSLLDDRKVEFSSATQNIEAARYSNGTASFTKDADASFVIPLTEAASQITLRVWDYEFGPVSMIASDGEASASAATPGTGSGLRDVTLAGPFSGPVTVDLSYSGRAAFMLDGVKVQHEGKSIRLESVRSSV